jgi:hypothetical protein
VAGKGATRKATRARTAGPVAVRTRTPGASRQRLHWHGVMAAPGPSTHLVTGASEPGAERSVQSADAQDQCTSTHAGRLSRSLCDGASRFPTSLQVTCSRPLVRCLPCGESRELI